MSEITRRSFIATGTAAAVGSGLPRSNHQTNFSRPIIGYWTREIAERLHWQDAKTAVLRASNVSCPNCGGQINISEAKADDNRCTDPTGIGCDQELSLMIELATQHEGPVFKFSERPLNAGESAIVHVTFDACYRRGKMNHRPATRIVVRVKPANQPPRDGGDLVLEETGNRGCYLGPRSSPVYITNSTWTPRELQEESR